MTALALSYAIRNATVRTWPYHHIIIEDVFPADLYRAMRDNLPPPEAYRKLGDTGRVPKGAYPQRSVLYFTNPEYTEGLEASHRAFWADVGKWLLSTEVTRTFVECFVEALSARFPAGNISVRSEACLMRDAPGYALGPHTDSPRKVVSVLFYLPPEHDAEDDWWKENWWKRGTSVYVPKDRAFTCPGGPHHNPDGFERVMTVPFRPNTLFAFAKTDNSFHGVERVEDGAPCRELMLYDVYRADA